MASLGGCVLSALSPIVLVLILSACPWGVEGWDNGAPTGSCTNYYVGHGSEIPSYGSTITLSSTTFSAGTPITVTVSGTFQGILMQAKRTSGSATPIGTWTQVPANTKQITCTKAKDTVTHSNTNPKNNAVFTWMPPSFNPGSLEFKVLVAPNKQQYIVKKSSTITPQNYASGPLLAGNQIKVSSFLLVASLLFFVLIK